MTLGPYLFGRAVDDGILGGSTADLLAVGRRDAGAWSLVGGVFGVVFHTLVVRTWLIGLYGTTQMVTRKIAQMGHVLPRRSPTGEVLSVASSDSDEFGALTEILARLGGPARLVPDRRRHRAVDLVAARPAWCWWPRRSSSAPRCRCCVRCTAARRSSAPATPT